jgi:hypothetical protein
LLIDIQEHHLHRQLKALDLGIWEKRLGVLLRVVTGFVGIVVAAGLVLMLWDAAHADGFAIDSFSVPPDLASRGLTGDVIATQVLDKIAVMQNDTRSMRPAQSYSNNIGNNIKEPLNKLAFECSMGLSGDFEGMDGQLSD